MVAPAIRELGSFLIRNRYSLWDTLVLVCAAGLLLFLAGEYDIFILDGFSTAEASTIELSEVLVVVVVLGVFLFVAARRAREQARELERRILAEAQARELALEDPLTGLANRRQFDEAVTRAIETPPGAERAHAVLLMDLNGFKSINDTFGHPIGDVVLKEIGFRLSSVVRGTDDRVARLGGDEFGIIALQIRGPEDANGIALRVIKALQQPVQSGKIQHTVGTGIGIALFPRDGATAQEIVRRADVALYRAKLIAGGGICFFEEQMDVQIRERAFIETELRNALVAGDIQPHYQPVISLGTNEIVGFEALARWRHHSMGEVPPQRFIPVAEASGLIRDLGDHLLRTACSEASRWPSKITLAFNVSPIELRDPTFGLRVLSILGETGLSPHRLELEITENTLVRDLKLAEDALGQLRTAGVRIALDDFGTGYSSLYHLRKFKFDRIKIDRSFVESMNGENESAVIIRALLGLGHGLGVQITAEGIESLSQKNTLIQEGCDQGQGFLFSAAVPAAEARALLGVPVSVHNTQNQITRLATG